MVTKNYNVSLDEEDVNKAKKIAYGRGAKLSSILNLLLKGWIKKEEKKDDIN
jgi:hypothetical protein